MPGTLLADLRQFAEDVAFRAGSEALAGRRGLGVGQSVVYDTKSSPTDPVTEFDHAAEALIVDAIRSWRPHDTIVGEEGAAHTGTSGLEWHVDPIDGTANFVYDLPAWCTSVAVIDAAGPLVGAVHVPVTGELFSAARGLGATRNGQPIQCSRAESLGRALVATGFSYSAERRRVQAERLAQLISEVRDVRRLGSAALDLCLVASGRVDAYFEEYLNSWDLAAGVLIAAEAGAVTSDLAGGAAGTGSTVAAAPGIHAALLATIASIDARSGS
jgi:myo-inositol-1(or 4)-monophosphatase